MVIGLDGCHIGAADSATAAGAASTAIPASAAAPIVSFLSIVFPFPRLAASLIGR
jgi:hypothetical protein